MSKLHHIRVRRARGLAMPLPPRRGRPIEPTMVSAVHEGITTREVILAEHGANWRIVLARSNFEKAYVTASMSSQPEDWHEAALLGKQLVNALDGRP